MFQRRPVPAAALRSPVSSSGDELQLLITSWQNQPEGEELRSYSTLLSTIASRQSRTFFRMAFVEGRDEGRIKDVRTGNPGSFFGSISIPIHKILKSTPPTPNIQDPGAFRDWFDLRNMESRMNVHGRW
ncbi:hypothetical protein XENORESO_007257 [Xenotaenia resolanae]|uniref:Uncharacterized protein n=1 Tax=Xenotaenia resolanae TaxID=208358 RepID=A0ABV0W847_9TELE